MYRKVTRVTDNLYQVLDMRNEATNGWQTPQKRRNNNRNNSTIIKPKRVLNELWAELSPAHRGRGGGLKLDEQKSPPRGKPRQQRKNKADRTTKNKQGPQDTPTRRRI
jgi:hypothetical protein